MAGLGALQGVGSATRCRRLSHSDYHRRRYASFVDRLERGYDRRLMRSQALFLVWLSAAIVLGASGALARLQPPLPQMVPPALTAVLLGTGTAGARPHLVLAWSVIGLADIAMVVVRAAEMASRDPGSMGPLLRPPLSLLPTFLVPIIIASHLLIFVRLRRQWRGVA